MRPWLLLAILLVPLAASQAGPSGMDATIVLSGDGGPVIAGPPGLVTFEDEVPGERWEFAFTLTEPYTTVEVRAKGLALDRPKQLVPMLDVPDTEFPLFRPFPHERVWEVDSPATVYHANGTGDDLVLRLGLMGPRNVTLVLQRDVEPPAYTLSPVLDVTSYSFYQESNTSELAIGDLQVRKPGSAEWVPNPTPEFHVRQRFPVQGLVPDAVHEARIVFTDWAGNEATTEIYRVRTLPAPVGPTILVTPVSPAPNATIEPGIVTIRANVSSPGASIPTDGVRVFFDKREVTPDVQLVEGGVAYTPPDALAPGPHSVSIEATNEQGGTGLAKWSFTVAGEPSPLVKEAMGETETPLPVWAVLAAVALAVAVARRRS